jgi:predicted dehydrogenase
MATTLGWGLIGCGDVAAKKSGPAIRQSSVARLVTVMRRDAARARAFAEAHGVPRWTTRAEEVYEDRDVDIVYVATPPSSHRQYVVAAAEAGKHVLVEKPMGLSAAEDR